MRGSAARRFAWPVSRAKRGAATSEASPLPRLLVLGCGWGCFTILTKLNPKLYDVSVVSPRDHMLFTPLLASTTVGTIEHRSVMEPLRTLIARHGYRFYQGEALAVDPKNRQVEVRSSIGDENVQEHLRVVEGLHSDRFRVDYDYLIIGVGALPNTFSVPGVYEYAFFLKEARDSMRIRGRLHDCLEASSYPTWQLRDPKMQAARRALLTFCIVGGGPTGCEFAGELSDFIAEDVRRAYPSAFIGGTNLWPRVVLLEASGALLGAFESSLRQYALRRLRASAVAEVRLDTAVERVDARGVQLKGGERIDCGLVVWSTGVGAQRVVSEGMKWAPKEKGGRLRVTRRLRVDHPDAQGRIFALGDCAGVEGTPLPAIAQVAEQQGEYLAKILSKHILTDESLNDVLDFSFHNKGMLAYLGGYRGVASVVTGDKKDNTLSMRGPTAWFLWRGAYLSKLGSWRNRLQVAVDWFKTLAFGRDSTRA